MGTISSGVGLISGLDIENVVSQLLAIEARPRDLLTERIEGNTTEQTALMQIQAMVMALQISSANFNKESIFQNKTVLSSNEDILTATANKFAVPGSYDLIVKQLAASHHFVSRGYSSAQSQIGQGAISFEIGQGQVARATDLNLLNGQQGVQRGKIQITDRAGNTATIDLSIALDTQDVLDAINQNSQIQIQASVSGNHFVLTDLSGGTGSLIVENVGLGHTAEDLGIQANLAYDSTLGAENRVVGQDVFYLTEQTSLTLLNDGNGIRGLNSPMDELSFQLGDGQIFKVDLKSTLQETVGAPQQSTLLKALNGGAGIRKGVFEIIDQNGDSVTIDLTQLDDGATVGELKTLIETRAIEEGMVDSAGKSTITVTFGSLDHLKITDSSKPSALAGEDDRKSNFIIQDLDGGSAAADLGIVEDVAGNNIHGEQIWFMETIGDVVNAVNNHWQNNDGVQRLLVDMSIDAQSGGLVVVDRSGGASPMIISGDSAEDMGINTGDAGAAGGYAGRELLAGLNTVMIRSLNGGTGSDDTLQTGVIELTDRAGNTAAVDLSGAVSLQDVIEGIIQAGTNIRARINDMGNGILLEDTSTTGTGAMIVRDQDASGNLAQFLNIAVEDTVQKIDSGNLQLQYISEAAALSELRQGEGIRRGKFTITDGHGGSAEINLAQDKIQTLEDVIDEINGQSAKISVRARINDTGDGILLYDTEAPGDTAFQVLDESGGNAAKDLAIRGTATLNDQGFYELDGTYEFRLELGGGDTIQDVVDKINQADRGLKASLIFDGSSYRISFNSQISGQAGQVYMDPGQTSLTTQTLTNGRDAILLMGEQTDGGSLLIHSSSNTVEDAVKGVTLELNQAGNEKVNITVDEDIDGIVSQMNSFVQAYNSLMKAIAEATSFNNETYEKGILFSDHTTSMVKQTVQSLISRVVPGIDSAACCLGQVGISFAPFGSETVTQNGKTTTVAVATVPTLRFDEAEFRATYAANPEAVMELFTKKDVGVGDHMADLLEDLAGNNDSTISNRLNSMNSQKKVFENRVEHLQELLDAKETRLYNQFYAMEQALASLQSQQSSLSSLSGLLSSSK